MARIRAGVVGAVLAATLVAAGGASASPGVSPRIVGGTDTANPGWIAYLNISFSDGDSLCGGELISKSWVLTAAHCVTSDGTTSVVSPGDVTAWIGLHKLSDSATDPGAAVDQIMIHPAYDPASLHGDVALLRLSSASAREPVALGGPNDPAVGSVPSVLGWGVVDVLSQTISDVLQTVSAPILAPSACAALEPGYDATSKICAGGGLGQDSCSGDSGGPLVLAAGTSLARLVGTVDYGSEICGDGQPSVYQRVTSGPVHSLIEGTAPTARIALSSPAVAGQEIALIATGNLLATPTYAWDLDGDGQFDDASGKEIPVTFGTEARSFGVRIAGSDGEIAKQRMTVVPTVPHVAVPDPRVTVTPESKTAREGSTFRLWIGRSAGLGTVRATLSQPGFDPVTASAAPGQSILSLSVPGDTRWGPPRTAQVTVSAAGARLASGSAFSIQVNDDDTPRISLVGLRRRGAREIVLPIKVPGPGAVKVVVMSATDEHALLRKRLTFTGTTRKVVLRFGRKTQRILSKARPRIRVTWISSAVGTSVVRNVRGPRLRRP